ncbi:MAG: DUF5682 family protein [Planctomycetota bacterium]
MPTQSLESRIDALTACESPWLIGVRHHSAVLAKQMPALLEKIQPQRICIELPEEFESWIEWITHKESTAPIALAASGPSLFFYPLADFSPELAAIRWGKENDVPIRFIDLPLSHRGNSQTSLTGPHEESPADSQDDPDPSHIPWMTALQRRLGYSNTESLWERLVEAPSHDSDPDSIRRAALLFGMIIREDTPQVSHHDRLRESWMRRCLAESNARTVAVIGSFHAMALPPGVTDAEYDAAILSEDAEVELSATSAGEKWETALIPYSFAQLDSRSGYPAGVLDPVWHQTVWASDDSGEREVGLKNLLVDICRRLRKTGVNASTADAISAFSFARDLSRLRNLAAPGRTELHEALTSTLVQGEQIGRRNKVGAATRHTLIGHRRGKLAPETPRSGMVSHVEQLIATMRLPGPDSATQDPKRMRLDVLRNPLDRARSVTLERMTTLQIPYAKRLDDSGGSRENLTEHWEINWNHATSARLHTVSSRGINLQQAVEAVIRGWSDNLEAEASQTGILLDQLATASRCGVGKLVNEVAERINSTFPQSGDLGQIVSAANWYRRIANGLIPGLPVGTNESYASIVQQFDATIFHDRTHLLTSALSRLKGILGTEKQEDCRAVFEIASWIESGEEQWPKDGGLRFRGWLKLASREGSPLLQGVAVGCQINLGMLDFDSVESITTSWWDFATTAQGRVDLTRRLSGWLFACGPNILGEPRWMQGIDDNVTHATDEEFLKRLLPLHSGFKGLRPKQRERFLESRLANLPGSTQHRMSVPDDPIRLATNREQDNRARAEILRVLPNLELRKLDPATLQLSDSSTRLADEMDDDHQLSVADRWHLILGGKTQSSKAAGIRKSFGDLLGESEGQGAGEALVSPQERSGGDEAPEVSSRDWAKQLEKLLGSQIAEEVLVEAAARGRSATFQVINPNRTPANPDLLRQILSMYSQADNQMLQRLKTIAQSIADRLAKRLAIRLQPHLRGLMTARPRNRPSPTLDLHRTLRRNLKHTWRDSTGVARVVAAQPVFRTPATRNMDWSIHLVVDVSGSMETSTIYAALVASIFARLPSIRLQFVTFSTEVADLSQHVSDPLSLLTEVRIGGGTHIAKGLRAARANMRVHKRSMVVLITDFHEGVSVPELLGEVRSLANSGARLIGLAALDDDAGMVYHTGIAQQCVSAGMPVAALSPERLADWVARQIRNG